MADSIYTLLIVESPVLADRIQQLSPSSVYVLSTDGFCWNPTYNPQKNTLKAIANPEKVELRKEIKEQAQWANNIVIAADSDPSGDFITWSLAKFLKMSGIKRGRIQHLSKSGVLAMLSDVSELNSKSLETRLKNRFLIQNQWSESSSVPGFQISGIIAALGAVNSFRHFVDENDNLYHSSAPFHCAPDEWISVQKSSSSKTHRSFKPLSTFDVIAKTVHYTSGQPFTTAQNLLQQLFQTTLPFSNDSLISYPRTGANAFYSETWENFREQYVHIGSQTNLKPRFLQEVADPETPHESIYPLSLKNSPESISGELPGAITKLYRFIYNHTVKSIKLPELLQNSLVNELNPEIFFYPDVDQQIRPRSIRPVITVNDFGAALYKLGVIKPSKFGKFMDTCIYKKWVSVQNECIKPGIFIAKKMDQADSFSFKLKKLAELADSPTLTPETVQSIITS